MEQINLLDCTLRDGGYINDWRFGEDAIKDIIENLSQTGVDVLEIGFLKNEPYQKDRTVFNSMEQVKELIAPKKPGMQYAVMCEVVNPLPLDMLAPADEDSADIIRVIVWKTKHDKSGNVVDALEEGYNYCKGIVEKGYKLCVQPARVDQYSDEEFVAMVRRFSDLNPLAIYVVDSWGTQNPENLLHYMHLADENMPAEIILGYHGHNNMMQALSAAQAMLKEGFSRKIMIDASVYGIGRGAGNLNLENIAKYLNEHCSKNYKISPMLEVNDCYIQNIYKMEQWGYSIPYSLTAKYNCNPNYARQFHLFNAQYELFELFLKQLSNKEKVIFNSKLAAEFLSNWKRSDTLTKKQATELLFRLETGSRFEKNQVVAFAEQNSIDYFTIGGWNKARYQYRRSFWKKKLAVIIPTANRKDAIEYYLNAIGPTFALFGVDIIIYDSSDSDDVSEMVAKLKKTKAKTVRYHRYTGSFDGISLDDKVRSALLRFSDEYEYLWVCRDGLVVNLAKIYDRMYVLFKASSTDVISVYSYAEDYEKIGTKAYRDRLAFFKDNFRHMTILGAIIVKSSFIQDVIKEQPIDKEKNYGLWFPTAIFHYIADHDVSMQTFVGDVFFFNQHATPSSFWNRKGRALWQWGERWYKIISNMPKVYDDAKPVVQIIEMQDFHPFGNIELLIMRGTKSLTYKTINENKQYLLHVTNTPLWIFYFVASIPPCVARKVFGNPNSWMTRTLYKIGKRICKFTRMMRKIDSPPQKPEADTDWWR